MQKVFGQVVEAMAVNTEVEGMELEQIADVIVAHIEVDQKVLVQVVAVQQRVFVYEMMGQILLPFFSFCKGRVKILLEGQG